MEQLPQNSPYAARRAEWQKGQEESHTFTIRLEQVDKVKSLALVEDDTAASMVRKALGEYIDKRLRDEAFSERYFESLRTPRQNVELKLANTAFELLDRIAEVEGQSSDQALETAIEEYYDSRIHSEGFMERARHKHDALQSEMGHEPAGDEL